jgi:hypothetical protein
MDKAHILLEIRRTAEQNGGLLLAGENFSARQEFVRLIGTANTGRDGAMLFARRVSRRIS